MSSSTAADEAIKRIHLKAIQNKIDENAYEIVNTTARCAIYEWDKTGWEKTGIEGSLFIFKFNHNEKSVVNGQASSKTNGLAMAILNKTNTDTVKLELNEQVEVKKSEPYLMYFNKKSHGDQIVGIWFNDTFSFLQATQIITTHLNKIKQQQQQNSSEKSQNTENLKSNNLMNKMKGLNTESPVVNQKINGSKQKTVSTKPNGITTKKTTTNGSTKMQNGKLTVKEEDTTEEDLLKILSKKSGNSILEKLQPDKKLSGYEKRKQRKQSASSRSRNNSIKSSGKNNNNVELVDIITDASGLKPHEPLIVHQLFSSAADEKSKTSKKQRKGSTTTSNGKDNKKSNKEVKPDILAMLQKAEKNSKINAEQEEQPSSSGFDIIASFSEQLVEPPSTATSDNNILNTPKRKNKKITDKKSEQKKLLSSEIKMKSSPKQNKSNNTNNISQTLLESPSSDNDAKKSNFDHNPSKLLSPQVFKNKNKTIKHDVPTPPSPPIKTPLTELLLGQKNKYQQPQYLNDETAYGSTPPAITAETMSEEDDNGDDFELSTRFKTDQSFNDAEESQEDNSINLPPPTTSLPTLSRESLRDTLIHLLMNDNSFVDQIHSAYLSKY